MAQRALLHKNKVAEFAAWCETAGVATRPGKGAWELLQVCFPPGQWSKLYARANMPEHVTVQEAIAPLVRRFIGGTPDLIPPKEEERAAPSQLAFASISHDIPPWE